MHFLYFCVQRVFIKRTLYLLITSLLATQPSFANIEDLYLVINVVNNQREPVSDAVVSIGYYANGENHPKTKKARTDFDGTLVVTASSIRLKDVSVEKEGFYSSWVPGSSVNVDELLNIELNPVRNPIPLYARKVVLDFPLKNVVSRRFDFFEGDWVAPHGSGKVADLEITELSELELSEDRVITDDRYLKVSFPNQYDGIVTYPLDYSKLNSDFPYPYSAPEQGYENAVYFKALSAVDAIMQPSISPPPLYPFAFVRIRSAGEKNSVPSSAYYLKLYPSIQTVYSPAVRDRLTITITYYLNKTENQRNLEFQPNRNLFSGNAETPQLDNLNLTQKTSFAWLSLSSPKLKKFLKDRHYQSINEVEKWYETEFEITSRESNIVFITNGAWTGNLGGIDGAHKKCQVEANAVEALKGKKFKAWISGSVFTGLKNDPHFLRSTKPYTSLSGNVIAEGYKELTTNNRYRLVDVSPTGDKVVKATIWSNTSERGRSVTVQENCKHWTSGSEERTGEFGTMALELNVNCEKLNLDCNAWTRTTPNSMAVSSQIVGENTKQCNVERSLICFQQ